MSTHLGTYVEPGWQQSLEFLPDDEYARAISALVFVCTDIVLARRASGGGRGKILLVKRAIRPAKDMWWKFGGRMIPQDFTHEESAQRCLKRETGLGISLERFHYVGQQHLKWKDREQEPQNVGCSEDVHTFAVFLTSVEVDGLMATLSLSTQECGGNVPVWADRAKLHELGVHPSIMDVYNELFPDNEGGA